VAEDLASVEYAALSEFRYQIRRFLHFSETAAKVQGIEPQQHQLLLTIRALNESDGCKIGALAQYLLIQHHSAVGLVDRLEIRGLVQRRRGNNDRREVRVHLTADGAALLRRLTDAHRAELRETGPILLAALAKAIGIEFPHQTI
jgi:DNA-binding MarR family transcriptional regulator